MVSRLKDYQFSNLDQPISALEVRETVLDDDVIEAIVDLLQARSVNTVQLDDCGAYMNAQAIRMARALGSVKNVRLSEPTFLSHNFLDSMLVSATKLTNLRIQDRLDCRQIEALATGLKHNTSVEVLDLSRSRLDSFALLADGLKGNKTIKVLKLRSLGLNDENVDVLLDALKGHPSLETLDMSFNHCRQLDGLAALIEDPSSQLRELSLGYQNLWQSPKIEIAGFAQALCNNRSIKTLSLARSKLTDSDMLLLATTLTCNEDIEKLDLRENLITDEGISVLAGTIESGTGIRRLSVLKNLFGCAGALALLNAVRTNHNVFQVDIGHDTDMCHEIRYECALNKGGRRLLSETVPLSLWPLVLERINKRDFGNVEVCVAGFSFDDLEVTSHQLDVFHFMVRGPALFEGAICS
jgi:hypothetical protein